jgi:hypothetical protein
MKLRSTVGAVLLATGLLATGAAPVQGANISVQPYGLSFGPQRIGTASTPRTLSVVLSASYGTPGASFSGLQIADPGSLCAPSCAYPVPQPDFGATTDCPTYVAGSASCHIYVTFHPAYPPSGPRAATLWALVDGASYHAPLSGTAVAPPKKCKKHKSRSAQTAKKRCKKK